MANKEIKEHQIEEMYADELEWEINSLYSEYKKIMKAVEKGNDPYEVAKEINHPKSSIDSLLYHLNQLKQGKELPPVLVDDRRVIDGAHRVMAALIFDKNTKIKTIGLYRLNEEQIEFYRDKGAYIYNNKKINIEE